MAIITNHNPGDNSSNNPAVLNEDFNNARKRFSSGVQGSDMLKSFIPINSKSQTNYTSEDTKDITTIG